MKKSVVLKKCGWLLGCVFAVMSFSACSDDENKTDDFMPGDGFAENMTLLPEKGYQSIKFTANTNWNARSNQDWLKLDGQAQTSGKMGDVEIYMTFEENKLVTDRTADIALTVGNVSKTIKVTQKATGRVIVFDGVTGDTIKMPKDQKEIYTAKILANVEWEFVADSLNADAKQWIKVEMKDKDNVAITILSQDGLNRTARLVFRDKNFPAFTKALFVAVGGWGENYLDWSLSKKAFNKAKDSVNISVTFVPDVAPRALVIDEDGDTTETTADWVSFMELPAAKSALQTKTWRMRITAYEEFTDRMAIVVMAPANLTNEQVLAGIKTMKSEKIIQTNPIWNFYLWRFMNGNYASASVPVTDGAEFTFMESKLALQIITNCQIKNLRGVNWNGTTESEIPAPQQMFQNLKFRTGETVGSNNSIVDVDLMGTSWGPANARYIAMDMYKNDVLVEKVYFKVMIKSPF